MKKKKNVSTGREMKDALWATKDGVIYGKVRIARTTREGDDEEERGIGWVVVAIFFTRRRDRHQQQTTKQRQTEKRERVSKVWTRR